MYACEKFHYYFYGRRINVRTDHKPLVSIMQKDVHKVPSARLQRMKLRLLKYSLNVNYIPGKYLYVADFLSRYFNTDDEGGEIEELNELVHSLNISSEKLIEFKKELNNDKQLRDLKNVLLNGWPIEKTKARARTLVYWARINEDIENLVNRCETCQKFKNLKVKAPMLSHTIPSLPFQKIGIDLFELDSKNYLALIDFYSKYVDIISVKGKTAFEMIIKLKNIFSVHGIPKEIVADNNPFNSYAFKEFCNECDVTTTSPMHSQANGFTEKAVNICKNLIKKCKDSKSELWRALLEYRNTLSKEVDAFPIELLMSRKTRSLVPANKKLFDPKIIPNINKNIENKRLRQKRYYDRSSKIDEKFENNETVWFHNKNKWVKAHILYAHGTPRSFWIRLDDDGTVLRRNSNVLRKRKI